MFMLCLQGPCMCSRRLGSEQVILYTFEFVFWITPLKQTHFKLLWELCVCWEGKDPSAGPRINTRRLFRLWAFLRDSLCGQTHYIDILFISGNFHPIYLQQPPFGSCSSSLALSICALLTMLSVTVKMQNAESVIIQSV